MGDLGGLCNKGEIESCTYPPPEHMFSFESDNCTEETMVWGLAIVALQLFKVDISDFYWDRVEGLEWRGNYISFIENNVPKILSSIGLDKIIIKEIKDKNYTLYNLIESMLEPDPKKRIKLNKIIEVLN